jgi:hypothetical protein
LKSFHCEIINDHEALRKEQHKFKDLPEFTTVTHQMINDNYYKVKQEIEELIESEIDTLINTPGSDSF